MENNSKHLILKVLLKRYHLNSHTSGPRSHTQKLQPYCMQWFDTRSTENVKGGTLYSVAITYNEFEVIRNVIDTYFTWCKTQLRGLL